MLEGVAVADAATVFVTVCWTVVAIREAMVGDYG